MWKKKYPADFEINLINDIFNISPHSQYRTLKTLIGLLERKTR